jgi:hypothetical protein
MAFFTLGNGKGLVTTGNCFTAKKENAGNALNKIANYHIIKSAY